MVNNNNEVLNNLGIEIIQTASLIHDGNQEEINQKLNNLLQNLHEDLQQSQVVQLKIPKIGMITRILGQEALFVRGGGKAFFWNRKEGVFYG
ncbi:MAG: hypothetical protein ACI86H_000685 [bacterium]|jgi:hypothetical protein